MENNGDMSTVHEAFQFLIKTFVETDEGWKSGIIDNALVKREEKLERRESMTSLMSIETDRKLRYELKYYLFPCVNDGTWLIPHIRF